METLATQNYISQLSPILGLIFSLSIMAFKFELHKKIRVNDEKGILLPSFFILASPFLSSFLFNISLLSIMDDNKILSSFITILTTVTSIYTANFLLDSFRESKKIQEKAKLFLYKLRESRIYLLLIKDEIKSPKSLSNGIYFGLSATESVNLLVENKVPDDLSIFDESLIEQIAEYSFTVKRFIFEFQKFTGNKEEEVLRNIMVIRADEAIIEVDLCILLFLMKYFSRTQESEINKLKLNLKRKYKELKNDKNKKLDELTLETEYDSLYNLTSLVTKCEYYSEYSIPNIEKVFESLKWDIN
jgi:hypothetical protein